MRKPIWVLLGVCLAGVLLVVLVAAGSKRREAFTLGVTPAGGVVELEPGVEVCQSPIRIPDTAASFDRIAVALGTFGRRGPAVTVTVEPPGGGPALGSGRLAPGYSDIATTPTHSVPVGRIDSREPFQVCLRNDGSSKLAVYGNGDASSRTSTAGIDSQPTNADIYLSFERAEPRSALSLAGAIFDRASLWRAPWIGAWLLIALVLVVVAGVPALLAVALRDVTGD